MSIPYLPQDDLIGLGISSTQIVDSIERIIRGSVEGTVWAAQIRHHTSKRYALFDGRTCGDG